MIDDNRHVDMTGWTDGKLFLIVTGVPVVIVFLAVICLALIPFPWGNYAFSILIAFLGINCIVHSTHIGLASYELDRRTFGFRLGLFGQGWYDLTVLGVRIVGVGLLVFAAVSLFRPI